MAEEKWDLNSKIYDWFDSVLSDDNILKSAYYADFATPFHVPLLHRSAVGRYVPMRQPLDQRGARERPSWHNRPATDLADALAHGLIALDVDYIRAINDAINNRIGYCALAELGMPAGWRELRAYQQGTCAQPALDDLEELSRALPADLFQASSPTPSEPTASSTRREA